MKGPQKVDPLVDMSNALVTYQVAYHQERAITNKIREVINPGFPLETREEMQAVIAEVRAALALDRTE